MLSLSKYFYFSLGAFLIVFSSPQMTQAQSPDNSGYSPVKPHEYCEDCEEKGEERARDNGEEENSSDIQSGRRLTRVDVHHLNYNLNLITNFPNKKSPLLAFGLEFFIGWGTGHFYAGNHGWGIYGLSGVLSMIYGAIQLGNNNFESALWFMVYGGISRLVNIVSAPLVTMHKNKKKKKKYILKMRKQGFSPYQYSGFQNNLQWQPQTPYTRIENNKSLVIPIFHTAF